MTLRENFDGAASVWERGAAGRFLLTATFDFKRRHSYYFLGTQLGTFLPPFFFIPTIS